MPPLALTVVSLQLFAFFLGNALHKILPATKFWTFGYTWSLNSGPFNIKEHVVMGFMVNVDYRSTYATEIIAPKNYFWDKTRLSYINYFYWLWCDRVSSSASCSSRWMLWPTSLVIADIYNTPTANLNKYLE